MKAFLNRLNQQLIESRQLKYVMSVASLFVAVLLLMGLFNAIQQSPSLHSGWRVMLGHELFDMFGLAAYFLPLLVPYVLWCYFNSKTNEVDADMLLWRGFGCFLVFLSLCGLGALEFSGGGLVGTAIALISDTILRQTGTIILLFGVMLFGLTLAFGLSWIRLANVIGEWTHTIFVSALEWLEDKRESFLFNSAAKTHQENQHLEQTFHADASPDMMESRQEPFIGISAPPLEKIEKKEIKIIQEPIKIQQVTSNHSRKSVSTKTQNTGLPSLNLLDEPTPQLEKQYTDQMLELLSREVETKLKDFGINVEVVGAHPGPVVTRYEMQLAPGIKVSKITALAKDLARSLSVISVRVVEVIPGKSVVGLELPNQHRAIVRLSEVLNSVQYQEAHSPLSLVLGKDIAGHPVVVDLGKMPHLLVAGTTGAGKSVGLNAMLLSLLFKATPDEVQMIMIDPKMLELSIYEGIPHLLTPVVTDMKEAANALRWCVGEMERRYKLMSALGVRNLAGFNAKILEAKENNTPILDPLWRPNQPNGQEAAAELQTLPYIVIVIDEFADMIMVVGKKVEELIARIAQKARAAGIHLILATQRPSVDVITGLIKANIPTRIAFQVSSKIDSRTILDQQGAEQLLGHGDMLYLAPGTGVPIRVHGAFVADHEVHQVVEDWKGRGSPRYLESILDDQNSSQTLYGFEEEGEGRVDSEADALYDEAVKIVLETRRASISSVQRRLRIGYNRAARLLEAMEASGLVSAMESNGTREVLVPDRESN